jgi:hypothetical protein
MPVIKATFLIFIEFLRVIIALKQVSYQDEMSINYPLTQYALEFFDRVS